MTTTVFFVIASQKNTLLKTQHQKL